MKYIDLKKQLKNGLDRVYLISGEDRYLCFDALKKLEDKADIKFRSMNYIILSDDAVTAKDVVSASETYPFGDNFRFILVKNCAFAKNKDEKKILKQYLDKPLESTVLVFFNPDGSDEFKGLENITTIDCSKLDSKVIFAFVSNSLAKSGISSSELVIEKLINYCNNDMTRVTNELSKLEAYTFETKVLTDDIVEKFVVKNREYQIFELAELIAKNDEVRAMELVDSFTIKNSGGTQIISALFNNYRRALFIALEKHKNNAEIAELLGIREYAVKMLRNQVKLFPAKKLKKIVDMITDFDKKIKIGEMKENTAVRTIVFNIFKLRGETSE